MTTTNDTDEPILAGDLDAQQADPEDTFDVNQEYPEAAGLSFDPTDVVAMAKAVQAGVPIQAMAEAHEASLATHTWTPGTACPMRSVNRKVHALTSIYDLRHDENTIVLPPNVTGVNWLARCETHEADFYSKTFAPAWKARNRPWEFCPECASIFAQRYGKGALKGKAVKKGKKLKTVTVAVAPPKVSTGAERKAKGTAIPGFEGPLVEQGTIEIPAQAASAQTTASGWLDKSATMMAEDAQAIFTPAPSEPSDPEEACWNEWSERLSKQAPKGAVIDWVGDYFYRVVLGDGRFIDLRVHENVATFKHTDPNMQVHYTDTLPQMLAEIG